MFYIFQSFETRYATFPHSPCSIATFVDFLQFLFGRRSSSGCVSFVLFGNGLLSFRLPNRTLSSFNPYRFTKSYSKIIFEQKLKKKSPNELHIFYEEFLPLHHLRRLDAEVLSNNLRFFVRVCLTPILF